MQISVTNLEPERTARTEQMSVAEAVDTAATQRSVDEDWPGNQQLTEIEVRRDPLNSLSNHRNRAANSLASARRTARLLWIALIISLLAHLLVPAYIVTTMKMPEKVALMDGTESLIISSLVPAEQSREVMETISFWAAKSLLDRGPQGFDAPDTLERVFLPQAFDKAKADFQAVAGEFAKKNIHQKLEISRIDLQRLGDGVVLSHAVGQLLDLAQIGGEQVTEPHPVTLNLKLIRNPYLGRNKRFCPLKYEYSLLSTTYDYSAVK